MRIQYRCPVDGCSKVYEQEMQMIGHMAGTMDYSDDHKWENVPISHHDLSEAKEKVPGVMDY